MRHSVRSSRTHTLKTSRGLAALAAILMGAGSVCLLTSGTASAAGAGLGGVATISTPDGTAPLSSGGSADQFTVVLPANASCSGDTANDGFHIYSYLVPEGTDVTTQTFTGNNPPTGTFGLVNNAGVYYGPVNTAITTGQVISIPNNFEWAPLATSDGLLPTLLAGGSTPGTWEAGLLCSNPSGTVTDSWNTQVTFTANSSDPNGFVWAASSGGSITPPTTTPTTAPGSTSTTTATTATTLAGGSTTTTTTADGSSTTTTTAVGGTVAGTSGTGSTGTGSTGSGSSGSSSPLPFTGAPITKFLGAGLLAVGVALMLLGWANRRVRLARSDRGSPR
jgi:hypothetical protein